MKYPFERLTEFTNFTPNETHKSHLSHPSYSPDSTLCFTAALELDDSFGEEGSFVVEKHLDAPTYFQKPVVFKTIL